MSISFHRFPSAHRVLPAAALTLVAVASLRVDAAQRTTTDGPYTPAGTNGVRIDALDAFYPELDAAIWIISSANTEIPLALTSPAGPGGLIIGTVSSMNPGLNAGYFSEGETSATVLESFTSEPFVEVVPGWEARGAYLGINFTSLPPGVDLVDPWTMWVAEVRESFGPQPREQCALCVVPALLCYAYYRSEACNAACWDSAIIRGPLDSPAPPAPPAPSASSAPPARRGDVDFFDWLGVLRRYRDEVLAATPEGQFYIDFYADRSLEMIRTTIASPTLAARLDRVAAEWAPAIQALVDGQGGTFTITPSMEDDLLALFDTYESVGSPDFAQAIAYERARLQLDRIAGLTMAEYQTQIETLGGVSAVESSSWGRVKALYR